MTPPRKFSVRPDKEAREAMIKGWPHYMQRIYEQGERRIAWLRKINLGPEGQILLPFVCESCGLNCRDLGVVSGDGLPICKTCIPWHPEPETLAKVPAMERETSIEALMLAIQNLDEEL